MTAWFDVDKAGLGKLLARRGKQFVIYELLQNAWDENSTEVHVQFERSGPRTAHLTVRDDNPTGFADLTHAWTLFAESNKKGDAEKRGRFNLGEKLVLALCTAAQITTTTGRVNFDEVGRTRTRHKTEAGSVFTGFLPVTRAEFDECSEAAHSVIPPAGIRTTFNGVELARPKLLNETTVVLPTEVGDAEGYLRSANRQTHVEVYEAGCPGILYEMGIPVVETGDRWHINVCQKVPLNLDRDNVRPTYLGKVRAVVLELMAGELQEADATSAWVRDAVTRHGTEMPKEVIDQVATLRFGERRVAFDPSDPEANALAVTKGYTVVHGGTLSKEEWAATRQAGAILPAGQVTPSPKPYSPDGTPLTVIPREKWTPGMKWVADYATWLGLQLMGVNVMVTLANDPKWAFNGTYGKGGRLTLNLGRLGHRWPEGDLEAINDLLVHEFGHEYGSSHLSEEYYDGLTKLAARLCTAALLHPERFKR